ncbi:hypothetical protein B0H66DRAFT_603590 [Apodospora peruviana]|uniref:Uncharacterized protein n=1 Tax=Apodospora peruviana TaxID=516989 RepID=A0AAE0M4H1_9PEZI|nr:hypothetical protein B0H66DRAFT_603590 [Apodospora peruviana]
MHFVVPSSSANPSGCTTDSNTTQLQPFLRPVNATPEQLRVWKQRTVAFADSLFLLRTHIRDCALAGPPPPNFLGQPAEVVTCILWKALGRKVQRGASKPGKTCSAWCVCRQLRVHAIHLTPLKAWGVKKLVFFGLGTFEENRQDPPSDIDFLAPGTTSLDKSFANFETAKHMRYDNRARRAMLNFWMAAHIVATITHYGSAAWAAASCKDNKHKLLDMWARYHIYKNIDRYLKAGREMPTHLKLEYEDMCNHVENTKTEKEHLYQAVGEDIQVYFHEQDLTNHDSAVLQTMLRERKSPFFVKPHVLSAGKASQQGFVKVDERTLVVSMIPDFPVREVVLKTSRPPAMIWPDTKEQPLADSIGVFTNCNVTAKPLPDREIEEVMEREYVSMPNFESNGTGMLRMYVRKDILVRDMDTMNAWRRSMDA